MYRVETDMGDVWTYDNLDDAKRAVYIFGGTITEINGEEDDFHRARQ